MAIGQVAGSGCCPLVLVSYIPKVWHKVDVFFGRIIQTGGGKCLFVKGVVSSKVGIYRIHIGGVEGIVGVITIVAGKKAKLILIYSTMRVHRKSLYGSIFGSSSGSIGTISTSTIKIQVVIIFKLVLPLQWQ